MPDPWTYAKESEHSQQAALFMWANMACRFGITVANDPACYTVPGEAIRTRDEIGSPPIPALKWLHAVHNQGRTPGQSGKIRGAIAKAEGVKAGVSDIFLPFPSTFAGAFNGGNPAKTYHGLYIEMKPLTKGSTSPEQREFQSDMSAVGYACSVARGWLEARKEILRYLQISC